MATRTYIHTTDDIDGTPDAETVTFALDGKVYEIDLSTQNAQKLRTALEPFIAHARRPAGGRRVSKSPAARRRSSDA